MSFHDIRFPTAISFGSSGGPERRTEIATLQNGFEQRNSTWAHSRRRYDAGLGARSVDDLAEIIAFFEARAGRLFGFRWKDWIDFSTAAPSQSVSELDVELGTGDGLQTIFPLAKVYVSGSTSYSRPISKPVAGTVLVAVNGQTQQEGADFAVDTATGVLTFSGPPPASSAITAGFEFDVPVRFDTDIIQASLSGFSAGEIPSVPVVEVRV